MNKRSASNLKTILIYVAVFILIVFIVSRLSSGGKKESIMYSDVLNYFYDQKVDSFSVSNKGVLEMHLKDNPKKAVKYELKSTEYFREDLGEIINEQVRDGILTEVEYEPDVSLPWWVSFLPYVVLLVLFVVMYFFMINQTVGRNGKISGFGRARVKTQEDAKEKVTFADVAGAEEEKEELAEIVDFLKNPERYGELGAKIPHGVLLMGPPGTGKTLLAKAVAGEANVPFLSISGSDFVEMYVGVGASRVRDLFETARKSPASIVFIDEIDAVGRHRGAGLGGGHDEREQTLNQLLVEMDGFGAHDGIIVMAATNRPDILDPALLRPGRFDRQITVNYPDIRGREEILKVHARNKKFEPDVDFSVIARTTAGFTGADLANLLNEAALLAVRRGKKLIGMPEIEDSFLKVVTGPQKKSLKLGEKEKRNTAYHEAGHAIAGYYLPTSDPVHTISIIPAGQTLGVTVHVPERDRFSVYRKELEEEIAVLLGGRVAEMLTFGDFSGGASNDIKRATEIAHRMVTQLGMSDLLGPIRYGSSHGDDIFLGRDFSSTQDYSDETAAKIDSEIRRIINEAYERVTSILTEHSDKLKFVAEYLVSHEMMDGDQFRYAMENAEPTVEALEALAEEKKQKSREANEKARREQQEREEEERRKAEEAEKAAAAAAAGEAAEGGESEEAKTEAEEAEFEAEEAETEAEEAETEAEEAKAETEEAEAETEPEPEEDAADAPEEEAAEEGAAIEIVSESDDVPDMPEEEETVSEVAEEPSETDEESPEAEDAVEEILPEEGETVSGSDEESPEAEEAAEEETAPEAEEPEAEPEETAAEAEEPVAESEENAPEAEEIVAEEEVVPEAEKTVAEVDETSPETEETVAEAEEIVPEAEEIAAEAEEDVPEAEETVAEADETAEEVEKTASESTDEDSDDEGTEELRTHAEDLYSILDRINKLLGSEDETDAEEDSADEQDESATDDEESAGEEEEAEEPSDTAGDQDESGTAEERPADVQRQQQYRSRSSKNKNRRRRRNRRRR